jgi:hypothetical protein
VSTVFRILLSFCVVYDFVVSVNIQIGTRNCKHSSNSRNSNECLRIGKYIMKL